MKQCSKCGEIKSLDEFSPNKNTKDGKYSMCKLCKNKYFKERRKTKEGIVTRIYSDQRKSSKQRGHPMPNYINLELKKWLFDQNLFHKLFDLWVESGYDGWKTPSCDRIDNNKPYTFGNMKLMTWQENVNNQKRDQRKGSLYAGHTPVLQYTKEGEFVTEYISQAEASRVTGVDRSSIGKCCQGIYKTTGGFIWKYKI